MDNYYTDNQLELFRVFREIGYQVLDGVEGDYVIFDELYQDLFTMPVAQQNRLLAQLRASVDRLPPAKRSLYDRAQHRTRPGTIASSLRRDIAAGTLPKVSFLVASAADCEHPSVSTPLHSANLLYHVLDALASDMETWSRSVLFVNFDENDGYFDHVPPPIAPRPASGNGDDWCDGKPIGLGPRVPMTVVSPWSVGGNVCSQTFDHTSVLRFLEEWTGVREDNISSWRRAVCGDLTSAFDFAISGELPQVAQPDPVPPAIDRWAATPPER